MRTIRRFGFALLTLALATLPALACTSAVSTGDAAPQTSSSRLPGDVRAAMVRGDWKEARKVLDERLAAAPDQGDLWLFLKALAFQYDGDASSALATLAELQRRFPESTFAAKARFQTAELQRAGGKMAEAAEAWERETRRLRSEERQGELARIYLDLADALSTPSTTPTAEPQRIDYAAAHDLYAAVLELEAPAKDRARALRRMTVCLERKEAFADCAEDCERFLAAFDPARTETTTGPRAPGAASLEDVLDVRLRRARAELRTEKRAQARREFEDAAEDVRDAREGRGPYAPTFTALDAAARARFARLEGEARLAIAATYSESDAREAALATAALRRFLASAPGHPRAAFALRRIAELDAKHGRTVQALTALDELAALPQPGADATFEERDEDARLRMQAVMEKGRLLLGQKRFDAAAAAFDEYAKRFPSGPDWSNAQSSLVECDFQRAEDHEQHERFPEARAAWTAFLAAHPLDARAAEIARRIGATFASEATSALERGKRPGAADDGKARAKELFQSAVDEWRKLAQRFPSSNPASQALVAIGTTLEERLGDLEGAVAAYRQCTFGASAPEAAQRLRAMTKPSLALATQGVWRQGGKPHVTAQVRNLEKLRVQTYRLDLATYFQKHRSYLGVEDLDLDLIAADATSEVAVANFARYAPLEQTIELPFEGPGTWVVAVTGGDVRATTLVIASQLDVIVKSSLREVFVFAQDVARGEPAEKARVLVALQGASGPRTVELTTGADGIARTALDEPCTAGPVSAFAERAGHVAAVGLDLDGLRLADPITPRALVYTDRPAYRPGHTVHWRAIVREVEKDRETFEVGLTYRVEIARRGTRTLDVQELALDAFGTLNGEFELHPAAPTGPYSITVRSPKGAEFHGDFLVEEFATQKIDLDLAFARPVVQRGETIEFDVTAQYYYGEPAADAPLRVAFPDGTQTDVRTDEKGKAHVSFPTRDVVREGLLRFTATLLEEGVERSGTVRLASAEYTAALRVPHDVVLAGDRFEAELTTRDAEGEPLGRALVFTVVRRESSPLGAWSEVEVAHQNATTDAKTGKARVPVTLERGGQYVLRAEALDRFGNPVTAQASVLASGDEDDVRLRLIAADGEVEVGGVARAKLVNRTGAGLALLTLEADGVLEHRILRLAAGTSDVELPVDDRAFPRAWLAIARMDGARFHEHRAGLDVVRRLEVTVEPLEPVYAPRGRAKLAVTAKDQLGRPVAAEFSIAVVDEALYDLYPDRVPELATVFTRGSRSALGVRTAASSAFAYVGAAERIAEEVLAEERAKVEKARWDARSNFLQRGLDDLATGAPATPGAPAPELAADEPAQGEQASAFGARKLGTTKKGRAGGPTEGGGRKPSAKDAFEDTETAFWTATLVTNADGRATVEFDLPERSTRWRATARGVGPGVLVGEAQANFRTRAELFLELRAPQTLVEGDRPRIVARVHDSTGAKGALELKLRVGAGERATTLPATVELTGSGVVEHVFEFLDALPACDALLLHLEGRGTLGGVERALATDARVPVVPWGIPGAVAASGVLASDAKLTLALDEGRTWKRRALEVRLGPSLQELLVGEALGEGTAFTRAVGCLPSSTVADAAAHLFGLAGVLELSTAAQGAAAERARLESAARGRITELLALQNGDGAWSWARGGRTTVHVETTCLAVAALARARAAGLDVPADALGKGVSRLGQEFRTASHRDDELEALIVWALAVADQDDFAAANRLHRARAGLSPAALAYTALALVEMERAPMAAEVADTLATKLAELGAAKTRGNGVWNSSPVEMTALAAYALGRAQPSSPRLATLVEELLAARPWAPARARGFALAALAWHAKSTRPAQDRSKVEVRVAGAAPRTATLAPGEAGATFEFEITEDAPRDVKVELTLTGGGRPHYSAVLRGFSSDVDVDSSRRSRLAITNRRFLAAPPVYRGRELQTGFFAVSEVKETWVNEVAHLPLGSIATVQVNVAQRMRASDERTDSDYLVLEVPLPAGTRVLENSVQGAFEAWHVEDGRLVVELGDRGNYGTSVEFRLLGTLPGRYRVLPVIVRSAFDPARWAAGAGGEFEVLARGETSTDAYKPTPVELFQLGQACFAAGERERARELLERLDESFGTQLQDDVLKQTAEMLLYLSIERGDARGTVRHFEVLREKNPELTIPFEQILAVGAAYRKLDEHERALYVFKAIVEETFGKDLKVIGALDRANDADAALRTFARLLRDYPDSPGTLEAELALCDRLLTVAPKASNDASLRKAGRDRAALTLDGVQRLQRFLSMHPKDPLAPEAGLNLVNAYFGIEDYERTSALGRELAAVYTERKYADAFLYAAAVADWYRGRDDDARKLLWPISSSTWKDESGVEQHSPNRDLAFYILAQIHHARKEFADAAKYYGAVETLFADAHDTLLALREKSLTLPEITTARPGERVELVLGHRNVTSADLLVYPVDLMTLYLREKTLANVAGIELAGISPTLRRTVELPHDAQLRAREEKVELALKEPGAYLVIARGDERHATGLVLVSDLELDVREDVDAGRLRVQLQRLSDASFVRGADVKVVGSSSRSIVAGKTDPRGLFQADGVAGTSTVIARLGEREYAFFRGRRALGAQDAKPQQTTGGQQLDAQSYFKNVLDQNESSQNARANRLQEEIGRERNGVQVKQVK
ncbi:MAG: MG2 domain-containing protein [Planctomycetota bacterium]